jgi:hypothetical protein
MLYMVLNRLLIPALSVYVSVVTIAIFSPSAHDFALFIHLSPCGCTFLLLYFDDMLITRDDAQHISHVK